MDYRKTLNLPKTGFKMKANLVQKEPRFLERWEKQKLYARLMEATAERPLYVLHDGPPYANGNIHLGTAFNKVLKDIILKSRRMSGFHAPYIPGWDCHGLPIEHNVDKELGDKKESIPILSKRAACRKYAEKWIKIQKDQFRRLGVLGDWDRPYLTMNFGYEAVIAREFHRFLLSDMVVRHKKPVYWCPTCHTALAEAEVEYHDHVSPSIYVKFPVKDDISAVTGPLPDLPLHVLIWTTTPWTLPANMAVAFHPDFVYAAVRAGDEAWILAEELVEPCFEEFGMGDYEVLATFRAQGLEGKACRHPFMDRDSLMVLADYVTADSGTGCVHTAPGHGADDFLTGRRYGLETLSPVDDHGVLTAEAGPFAGGRIPEVNATINQALAEQGSLVREARLEHSYPHCWRCKKPVIYRATKQWFISMEAGGLRDRALEAIGQVTWTPAWGQQRIHGMVEARPDWCLSRQRTWGVPLTVFICQDCGQVLKDEAACARVEELFEKEGADAWFRYEAAELLPQDVACACGSRNFAKETDILDVWFDSGVSHAAVCERREELRSPADLYLEGSDQHRGWFQSSLLASVGTRGRAPYKGVLTHGYVVDGQGRKMSKSVGNVVAPQEVIDKFGADILRLWVSSEDYRDDVKVSDEILGRISDAYRKIRNTIRFMLGNLADFDPGRHAVPVEDMPELDRWALASFEALRQRLVRAYEQMEFHTVYHGLHTFCGVVISSLYLDILKDRLYVSAPDDPARRAAQTAIHRILDGLLRLMAPVLSFTAAEAWEFLHRLAPNGPIEESVFFATFPEPDPGLRDQDLETRWERLLEMRGAITRVLEAARQDKTIGLALDARVRLHAQGDLGDFLKSHRDLLREVCIVSALEVAGDAAGLEEAEDMPGLFIGVEHAPGEKCERCWMWSPTVGGNQDHAGLCARCVQVVESLDRA